jgi:NitT/TauT family transport system substrate-binding protein
MNGQPKPLFYLAVAVVVLALVAFAVWQLFFRGGGEPQPGPGPVASGPGPIAKGGTGTGTGAKTLDPKLMKLLIEPRPIPTLNPAGEYKPQGDVVDIELSDWPGYAPIIYANGGLEPNADAYFAKKHGFKLKIKISEGESESWSDLNSGKMAMSSTTVDVLAIYGSQLKVEVPVQLDFSRGGDGILTLKEITSINQLKGKIVVVAQQTESDFFIRFLAQEAGLQVKPLRGLDDAVDPERINLLFTETAENAAEVFQASAAAGDALLAGCVTWNPYTVKVPEELPDKVRLLATNKNLLVVADVLIVNQGFAKSNPKIMKGLVEGILWASEEIRKNPDAALPVVAKVFAEGDVAEMRELLKDVHLSNHAENLLFFSPETGQLGTFRELYYLAVFAYGTEVVKTPAPPEKLVNRTYLEELAKEGLFKDQKVTIAPVKSDKVKHIETPLLTKVIRFQFEPDSAVLDLNDQANKDALKDIGALLKLAPGSRLHLVGHVDDRNVEEFKKKGQAFFSRQAMKAIDLSKDRAEAVRTVLLREQKLEESRIDTEGRGWNQPLEGRPHDENRRVEVQLFTLE